MIKGQEPACTKRSSSSCKGEGEVPKKKQGERDSNPENTLAIPTPSHVGILDQ